MEFCDRDGFKISPRTSCCMLNHLPDHAPWSGPFEGLANGDEDCPTHEFLSLLSPKLCVCVFFVELARQENVHAKIDQLYEDTSGMKTRLEEAMQDVDGRQVTLSLFIREPAGGFHLLKRAREPEYTRLPWSRGGSVSYINDSHPRARSVRRHARPRGHLLPSTHLALDAVQSSFSLSVQRSDP